LKLLLLADVDDLHWNSGSGSVDLVLALGDTADSLILEAAQAYQCDQIFAVKGNHDSGAPFPKPIIDLDLHVESFNGLTFGGLSGSWKYKPKGHFLYEQEEVQAMLSDFPCVDVFVSHNSPLGIHDKADDIHTGFKALTEYAQRHQPRLLIHGHQHQNVETRLGMTRVLGVYGHRLLELE
jgi:Icc-related predicted phosphoesterase